MFWEICCLLIGMRLHFATDDDHMTERHLGEYFCLPDVHRDSTAPMQLTPRISRQHRRGLRSQGADSFVLCDVMLIDLPFIAFYIYYDYVKRNDELPAAACKLDMDMDTGTR